MGRGGILLMFVSHSIDHPYRNKIREFTKGDGERRGDEKGKILIILLPYRTGRRVCQVWSILYIHSIVRKSQVIDRHTYFTSAHNKKLLISERCSKLLKLMK